MRSPPLHEERLAWNRGFRGVVPDRDLQRAHHRRPHVVLDVVVHMDTAQQPPGWSSTRPT